MYYIRFVALCVCVRKRVARVTKSPSDSCLLLFFLAAGYTCTWSIYSVLYEYTTRGTLSCKKRGYSHVEYGIFALFPKRYELLLFDFEELGEKKTTLLSYHAQRPRAAAAGEYKTKLAQSRSHVSLYRDSALLPYSAALAPLLIGDIIFVATAGLCVCRTRSSTRVCRRQRAVADIAPMNAADAIILHTNLHAAKRERLQQPPPRRTAC